MKQAHLGTEKTAYREITDPILAKEYNDIQEKLIKKSPVPVHLKGERMVSRPHFIQDALIPSPLTGNAEIKVTSALGEAHKVPILRPERMAPIEMHPPAILAHEIGHALDMYQGGVAGKLRQAIPGRMLGPLVPGVASVGGALGGFKFNRLSDEELLEGEKSIPKESLKAGLKSGLVAGAVSAPAQVPTLLAERAATKKGLELLKELGASEQLMENSRKSLKGAYGTYTRGAVTLPVSAALGAAIGGAALHGVYNNSRKRALLAKAGLEAAKGEGVKEAAEKVPLNVSERDLLREFKGKNVDTINRLNEALWEEGGVEVLPVGKKKFSIVPTKLRGMDKTMGKYRVFFQGGLTAEDLQRLGVRALAPIAGAYVAGAALGKREGRRQSQAGEMPEGVTAKDLGKGALIGGAVGGAGWALPEVGGYVRNSKSSRASVQKALKDSPEVMKEVGKNVQKLNRLNLKQGLKKFTPMTAVMGAALGAGAYGLGRQEGGADYYEKQLQEKQSSASLRCLESLFSQESLSLA